MLYIACFMIKTIDRYVFLGYTAHYIINLMLNLDGNML